MAAEKIQQYAREYKNAIGDIMKEGVKLKNPYGNYMIFYCLFAWNQFSIISERVRICLWIERLNMLRNDDLEQVRMKNEYIQYMRVCLQNNVGVLPAPFSSPPPQAVLVPLPELLANLTADAHPNIPRTGKCLQIF